MVDVAAYLNQGNVLGSRQYTSADDDAGYRDIQLNADGLAALNAALGDKIAFSCVNSEEGTPGTSVWNGTGTVGTADVADGLTQLIITWGSDASVPPTITTDAPAKITPNQVPVSVNVTATGNDGATITGQSLFVLPVKVNGAGKIVDKSYSAQWYVRNDGTA